MRRLLLLTLVAGISVSTLRTQQNALAVRGYFFGDYFYKPGGDSTALPGQYTQYRRDAHAFQFRRLYFWADAQPSTHCSVRFLLEATDASLDERRRYSFFVKEASITWDSLGFPFVQVQGGLIPTPTWRLVEQYWERSLERTVTDFWNWGNAVDFGIALRGQFPSEHPIVRSTLMVGSGEGPRLEIDRLKKLYAQIALQLWKTTWLELYSDWDITTTAQGTSTFKAFLGHQQQWFRGGMEVVLRRFHVSGQLVLPVGISFFGSFRLLEKPALQTIARYDWINDNRRTSDQGFIHHFALVGLEYAPLPQLRLTPNLWLLGHTAKGNTPHLKTDVVARLTFFVMYP